MVDPTSTALSARIAEVVAIDPDAPAIEFEGRWSTWGDLGSTIEDIASLVGSPGAKVGIILRNRPAHVGCLLGVLRGGGCVVTINPQRGVERTRDDIAGLDLSSIAATSHDLAELVDPGTAPTTIALDDLGESPKVTTTARLPNRRAVEPASTSRSRC